jgi:hypothetical protein
MQTKFDKMRAHRVRWVAQPIKAQEAAPQVPVMFVDGQAYVEVRERIGCHGCAFYRPGNDECTEAWMTGETVFGGSCSQRNVIYLKAE